MKVIWVYNCLFQGIIQCGKQWEHVVMVVRMVAFAVMITPITRSSSIFATCATRKITGSVCMDGGLIGSVIGVI